MATLFLLTFAGGCSEEQNPTESSLLQEVGPEEEVFAGVMTYLDVSGREIELAGNVLLKVVEDSRIYSRAGEPISLQEFALSTSEASAGSDEPTVIIVYYQAVGVENGKLILDWVSLLPPVQE